MSIFFPVEDWHEEDGDALFFKLDAGEPPQVTSPITVGFDSDYFTHWMRLPDEFHSVKAYQAACKKSGIETSMR